MNADWIRNHCLSLPGVTERVQWGDHLVFKVGGKIFVIASLEPGGNFLSFKASPENFAELPDRDGVVPAPYLARAQWLAVEREDAVTRPELKGWLTEAYQLVRAKLTKKVQAGLK